MTFQPLSLKMQASMQTSKKKIQRDPFLPLHFITSLLQSLLIRLLHKQHNPTQPNPTLASLDQCFPVSMSEELDHTEMAKVVAVLEQISTLNTNKRPGPDDIYSRALKKLKGQVAELFGDSMQSLITTSEDWWGCQQSPHLQEGSRR